MDPNQLRRRRLALGLSQTQLARRINVTKNSVARWERGELTIERPDQLDLALAGLEAEKRRKEKPECPNHAEKGEP